MKRGERNTPFFNYLACSEEDEKLGMVCTNAGDIEVPPNTVYPPNKAEHPVVFRQVAEGRTLPEFQLVYIDKGRGTFETEGASYDVSPGAMLLLLPGVKHVYKPVLEVGWHEYFVGFKGGFFEHLYEEGILSRDHVFFEIGLRDSILTLYNTILDEVRRQKPLFQMKVCSAVMLLLGDILAFERRKEQPNHYEQIVEKAKYLMETNIFADINMPGIAEQLGISTSRLNEIFKTYTAMTPYRYYIQIKIQKAAMVLEMEDISVKEAAFRLGFDDQYYFSRLFKQKTGIAPSAWKKFIYG